MPRPVPGQHRHGAGDRKGRPYGAVRGPARRRTAGDGLVPSRPRPTPARRGRPQGSPLRRGPRTRKTTNRRGRACPVPSRRTTRTGAGDREGRPYGAVRGPARRRTVGGGLVPSQANTGTARATARVAPTARSADPQDDEPQGTGLSRPVPGQHRHGAGDREGRPYGAVRGRARRRTVGGGLVPSRPRPTPARRGRPRGSPLRRGPRTRKTTNRRGRACPVPGQHPHRRGRPQGSPLRRGPRTRKATNRGGRACPVPGNHRHRRGRPQGSPLRRGPRTRKATNRGGRACPVPSQANTDAGDREGRPYGSVRKLRPRRRRLGPCEC